MKKKVISVLCLILILFNFIFTVSFADETDSSSDSSSSSTEKQTLEGVEFEVPKVNDIMKEIKNGESPILNSNKSKSIKNSTHNIGTTNSILLNSATTMVTAAIFDVSPKILEALGEKELDIFTVYNLVMGKYEFFNMNFYQTTVNSDSIAEGKLNGLGENVKKYVMEFYGIIRALSLGISIFVLIYIGIRMALSTLQTDRIKYRNMLIAWISSIMLLFFMHFIIIIYSYLAQTALNVIGNIADSMGIDNIEHHILEEIRDELIGRNTGFQGFAYLIVMLIFLYYECKFFIAYVHRFCEIAFLVTISPLVTITYSIDKVGDNKAQAFKAWLKELSIKYSIQVVHAITYCALIAAAGAIATQSKIVGALFLLSLDKAEKIFRNILNVNDTNFEKARVPFLDRHKGRPKMFG